MATITPERTHREPAPTLERSHRTVRSPLRQLRGKIRRYVITESLTSLVTFLALAFWVLLALDVGCYFLFGFDWVMHFPVWFRSMILGLSLLVVCFFVELRKAAKIKRIDPESGLPAKSALESTFDSPWLLFGVAIPAVLLFLAGWIIVGVLRQNETLTGHWLGIGIAAGLAAFAVMLVVKRMLYEFREISLAMVLERRYPRLLGDRLLTAVELANPKKVQEYGYSQEMVEHTIHEAAERVNRLSPSKVFDWPRLYWRGLLAVLMTAGAYAAALGTIGTIAVVKDSNAKMSVVRSYHHFNDAADIWFQRTVLLNDLRWPHRVQLELVQPEGEVHLIGRRDKEVSDSTRSQGFRVDETLPFRAVRVRSLKWIVRDLSVEARWRPLLWNDLSAEVLEQAPPKVDVPTAWLNYQRYAPEQNNATRETRLNALSLDELEQMLVRNARTVTPEELARWEASVGTIPDDVLGKPLLLSTTFVQSWRDDVQARLRKVLHRTDTVLTETDLTQWPHKHKHVPDVLNQSTFLVTADEMAQLQENRRVIEDVLGRLNRYNDNHPMSLTVRRLDLPGNVRLKCDDQTMRLIDAKPAPAAERVFVADLPDVLINDEIPYRFAVDDYETAERVIKQVPNPTVVRKEHEKVSPAYHFYDVGGFWPFDKYLAGLKQNLYPPRYKLGLLGGGGTSVQVPRRSTGVVRVFQGGSVTLFTHHSQKFEPKSLRVLTDPEEPKTLDGTVKIQPWGDRTIRFHFERLQERLTIRYTFEDDRGLRGDPQEITVEVDSDYEPHEAGQREKFIDARPLIVRTVQDSTFRVLPQAILPFSFSVQDDYGLFALDYKYRVQPLLGDDALPRRAQQIAATVGMAGGPSSGMGTRIYERLLTALVSDLHTQTGDFAVPRARQKIREQREFWQRQQGKRMVEHRLVNGRLPEDDQALFKEFIVKRPTNLTDPADVIDLDEYLRRPKPDDPMPIGRADSDRLSGLDLKEVFPFLRAEQGYAQPKYKIVVWVEAKDNNVEDVDRGRGSSQSHPWTFIVVSESELLQDIRRDELKLYAKLDELHQKLQEEEKKLQSDLNFLGKPLDDDPKNPARFSPLVQMANGSRLPGLLRDTRDTVTEVYAAYFKLYLEMRTNRVRDNASRARWVNILEPLSDSPEDPKIAQDKQAVKLLINDATLSVEDFGKALKDPLVAAVNARRINAQAPGNQALQNVGDLKRAIKIVMDRIEGFLTPDELIKRFEELLRDHEFQLKLIQKYELDLIEKLFGETK